ncbi:MAG: VIT1/CCC1 transporter family protein [Undibacterium sp.]
MSQSDETLGRSLVLDELADLSLYRRLVTFSTGETETLLRTLIPIEERHYHFWQDFFQLETASLDFPRRVKVSFLAAFCRLFGEAGANLVLEAIEINGIKKYLAVWERYKDEPLGAAVREILQDELGHEDDIVSDAIRRRVHPERIRDIFLGLNDGLVEILGAVSGFFVAFQSISSVLAASLTGAVAGAFSMAAGAYIATGSEKEAADIERRKHRFLNDTDETAEPGRPLLSAGIVGVSYIIGSLVPILPVFFGAENFLLSAVFSVIVVTLVSAILAFLSGMDMKRRIAINLVIVTLAVVVTALIGRLAKTVFGIEV